MLRYKMGPLAATGLLILMLPKFDHAQQARVQIDSSSQRAVDALRELARSIGQCPGATQVETEVGTWRFGSPSNVTWDVVTSQSVRSPYLGSIEFTTYHDFILTDYYRKFPELSAPMLRASGPLQFRYEFDISPGGITFSRAMSHKYDETQWRDFLNSNVCFDNLARNPPAPPKPASPGSASAEKQGGSDHLVEALNSETYGLKNGRFWNVFGDASFLMGFLDGVHFQWELAGKSNAARALIPEGTRFTFGDIKDMLTAVYKEPENLDLPVAWAAMACIAVKRGETTTDTVFMALRKALSEDLQKGRDPQDFTHVPDPMEVVLDVIRNSQPK